MLDLPSITLTSICAPNRLAATSLAMSRSMKGVKFGAVNLLDCKPSLLAYNQFLLYELHKHITTDYALICQWDGWVVNPDAWNPLFLKYDYIGARWPWCTPNISVGNGGFSLRSRRLMERVSYAAWDGHEAEDDFICKRLRPDLEKEGFIFAPDYMAVRFSYESEPPVNPTFGFHGLWNMHRHLNDLQICELCDMLCDDVFKHAYWPVLLHTLRQQGRWMGANAVARRLSL